MIFSLVGSGFRGSSRPVPTPVETRQAVSGLDGSILLAKNSVDIVHLLKMKSSIEFAMQRAYSPLSPLSITRFWYVFALEFTLLF